MSSVIEYAIYFYALIGVVTCGGLTILLGCLCLSFCLDWILECLVKDKGYVLIQLLSRFENMQKENPELAEKFIEIINERNTMPSSTYTKQAAQKLEELLNEKENQNTN